MKTHHHHALYRMTRDRWTVGTTRLETRIKESIVSVSNAGLLGNVLCRSVCAYKNFKTYF